jgi:hypothetical protein
MYQIEYSWGKYTTQRFGQKNAHCSAASQNVSPLFQRFTFLIIHFGHDEHWAQSRELLKSSL